MPGEVGPVIGNPETPPQVDLLVAFGDREITIFGRTGTFTELRQIAESAGPCPFKFDDINKSNVFVVKAANEAGMEIEPEYVDIFQKVTEQEGLQTKYTIVERQVSESGGKDKPASLDLNEGKAQPFETKVSEDSRSKPSTVYNKQDRNSEPTAVPLQVTGVVALREIIVEQAAQASEDQSGSRHDRDMPSSASRKQLQTTERLATEQPTILYKRSEASDVLNKDQHIKEKTLQPLDAKHKPYINDSVPTPYLFDETLTTLENDAPDLPTESPLLTRAEEKDSVTPPFIEMSADNSDLFDEHTAVDHNSETVMEFNQVKQEALISVWETELAKEPLVIYEDFTDSLAVSINGFDITREVGADDAVNTATPPVEAGAIKDCPAIVVEVFDRLQEVDDDEKVQLGEALKEISGAVHGLHILEARGAAEEITAEVEQQLEALCARLFDRLGIEYDEVAVRQFAMVMRHEAFSPALHQQTGEIELYLENIGTHEAKYFRREVRTDLTQASRRLIQALGTFVLNYAHTSAAA